MSRTLCGFDEASQFFFSFLTSGPKMSQNEADIAMSNAAWAGPLAFYMKMKYEADANLVKRTAFKWTILRPVIILYVFTSFTY